jgi:hypothetical protein
VLRSALLPVMSAPVLPSGLQAEWLWGPPGQASLPGRLVMRFRGAMTSPISSACIQKDTRFRACANPEGRVMCRRHHHRIMNRDRRHPLRDITVIPRRIMTRGPQPLRDLTAPRRRPIDVMSQKKTQAVSGKTGDCLRCTPRRNANLKSFPSVFSCSPRLIRSGFQN